MDQGYADAAILVYYFQAMQIGDEYFYNSEQMKMTGNNKGNKLQKTKKMLHYKKKREGEDVQQAEIETSTTDKKAIGSNRDLLGNVPRRKRRNYESQFHKYICGNPSCRNSWGMISRGESKPCLRCSAQAEVFMNRFAVAGRIYFGYFVCPTQGCMLREWESSFAFLGRWQKCRKCGRHVYPYELRKYPRAYVRLP